MPEHEHDWERREVWTGDPSWYTHGHIYAYVCRDCGETGYAVPA